MRKINPYRMLGRIAQLPYTLMQYNNLRPTQSVQDVRLLLMALSQKLSTKDSDLCLRSIDMYTEYLNQGHAMNLPQSEIDRLYSEGINETKYILRKYPFDYSKYLFLDEDFLAQEAAEIAAAKIRRKRTLKIVFGVIAAIIVGVVIYNLPYFSEMRAYDRVKDAYASGESWTLANKVDRYVTKFPEGKHLDEVLMMPVNNALRGDDNSIYRLDKAEDYLSHLPDGPHAADCRQVISDVWDDEIAKYQNSVGTPTEATEFVVDMLRYMKSQNIREIAVVSNPVLDLKDYTDYPGHIQKLVEMFYSDADPVINSWSVGKIKDKITENKASGWTSDVTGALNDGFNAVLTKYFINFKTVYDDEIVDPNMPLVKATFTVKTQEDEYGLPELWLYTNTTTNGGYYSASPSTSTTKQWILGMSMDFDMEFQIPGTDKKYNFIGVGDPGSTDIRDKTPETVYGVMCDRCVDVFADDLAKQLGLPQEAE